MSHATFAENQPQTGSDNPDQLLGNRYRLLGLIGQGGMGAVFRAYDRLTDEVVALKWLTPTQADWSATFANTEARGLLAQEFQALAALRHPNIIAVRDYGFDAEHQPYFTMDLLTEPQTILDAARGQSIAFKLTLLGQLLYALAYLHRHNIVHRDLKPENVLIINDSVKVLDFGLAALVGQANDIGGTLTYIAPEVLQGNPARTTADLYAVGIIAYELFAGQHPFEHHPAGLINAVLTEAPDLTLIQAEADLVELIARLLSKDPAQRYADAPTVITALNTMLAQPLPIDTGASRESFLQAARFVGRDAELAQLIVALQQAQDGRGSAWLIGGESGVGKSRLLAEVRTQALVRGMVTLQGQAVSQGGQTYHLWRLILRWLVLLTPPSPLEARVLKPFIPNLADLLGEEISDAPELTTAEAQTRLLTVVAALLRRASVDHPLLVLLEDLHWADANSLAMLTWLLRQLDDLPILLIATYRHGEAVHLADQFSTMQHLYLNRFSKESLASLSVSMLGQAGGMGHIVSYLQRQTEGNVLFAIEVVRALAEEAGNLDEVTRMTLPEHVFAGGIQDVIHRRLGRIAAAQRPLLDLAAVAGRRLDLAILKAARPDVDLEDWLQTCTEATVLAVAENQWQFSHDKLREETIQALDEETRRRLHHQVGQALEQVAEQRGTLSSAYVDLTYHFGQAGEWAKERQYARLAGEQAVAQFDNETAIIYLNRVLELTPEADKAERYDLLLFREKTYDFLGDRQAQSEDLATLEALAAGLADETRQATVALRQAQYADATSDFPVMVEAAKRAVHLGQARQQVDIEAEGRRRWGDALIQQGHYQAAKAQAEQAVALAQTTTLPQIQLYSLRCLGSVALEQGYSDEALAAYEQVLALSREIGDQREEAWILSKMGRIFTTQADYDQALTYLEQSLQKYSEIGDRRGEAMVYLNSGVASASSGQNGKAKEYYEQTIDLCREVQDHNGESLALSNLGALYRGEGDYQTAKTYFQQVLDLARKIGSPKAESLALNNLSGVATEQGDYTTAQRYGQRVLDLCREIGFRTGESAALFNLGNAVYGLNDYDAAEAQYQQALTLSREVGFRWTEGNALVGLGKTASSQGHYSLSQDYCQQALDLSREISNPWVEIGALIELGVALFCQGAYHLAKTHYEQALSRCRALKKPYNECDVLGYLSLLHTRQADYKQGHSLGQEALQLAQALGNPHWESSAWLTLGQAFIGLQEFNAARNAYQHVFALNQKAAQSPLILEAQAGLAEIALALYDFDQAQTQAEIILPQLAETSLDSILEPVALYWLCYRLLYANADPQAQPVLAQGYHLLQERAAQIADEGMKQSYLEQVTAHQAVMAEWLTLTTNDSSEEG